MITALYRISSNEVVKVSIKGQPFIDRDTTYWGVLTDPPRPDGDVVRESLPDGTLGPLRVLGFAKINDAGTVRNATQPEIDTWQALEDEDENLQDADDASSFIDTHPRYRKVFKALLKRIIAENNTTNAKANEVIVQWEQFKADVSTAGNLNAIKASVDAMNAVVADLPQRTLSQAITALKNDVSKDD